MSNATIVELVFYLENYMFYSGTEKAEEYSVDHVT